MLKENFESSTSSGSHIEHSDSTIYDLIVASTGTYKSILEGELKNIDNKEKLEKMKAEISDSKSSSIDGTSKEYNDNSKIYDMNTYIIIDTHNKIKDLREIEEHHNSLMMNNNDKLSDIDNVNMTSKRHIEINMNIIRKKEYMIKIFKIMLIVVVVLVIIPILSKAGIIDKNIAIMIWGLVIFIILLVMLYLVYYKNVSKDKNDYNKFNFVNPNSQEVARSKLNVDLSETDQARCQAFAEVQDIYDTNDINTSEFDIYKTSKDDSKCLA
tara:strand:- start:453 stop:1259 length:807 start_codon:yes stop_codon:yes gene_type:complete